MTKRIQVLAVTIIVLATSGCVAVRRERRAESWPEPTSAADVMQFDGTFSNRSVNRATGHPSDRTAQLFDFLTGQGHSHGERGVQVQIRFSREDGVLQVRLLDEHGVVIDSARLQPGSNFEFFGRFLSLYGPFSGTHARSTNMGAGMERQTSRIYLASGEGLFGQQSECGAGLLFYFVPFVGSSKSWMLWPKLAAQ